MENPYAPPQTKNLEPEPTPRVYGGIQRLPYIGIMVGLTMIQSLLLASELGMGILMITIISFIPAYYRLKNIGENPWWCLLLLIPIANLFIGIHCLISPEGYADTRKLDTAGSVVAYAIFALSIVVVTLTILNL